MSQYRDHIARLSTTKNTSTQGSRVLDAFRGLPNELLWEIFEKLDLDDLKSFRQSCWSFHDAVGPWIFRRVQLSFGIPRGGLVPPTATNRKNQNAMTPLLDHIVGTLNNRARSGIFSAVRQFRLTVPHLMNRESRRKSGVDVHATFQLFAEDVLPAILDAMPNLAVLRLDIRPDIETRSAVWWILESACKNCGRNVAIHVALLLRDPELPSLLQLILVNSLSHITSLRLAAHFYKNDELDEAIDKLVSRCPKLSSRAGVAREGSPDGYPETLCFVGPEEELTNGWFLPTREEVRMAKENRVTYISRVSWCPLGLTIPESQLEERLWSKMYVSRVLY